MILQRASSLSCAATSLPQTFATRRFYYHNHSGLPARPLKSTVWVPDSPAPNTELGCQTVLGCQTALRTPHSVPTEPPPNPTASAELRPPRTIRREEFTVPITVCSTSRRLQTSSPREAQPPRATAAPRLPAYRPSGRSVAPTEPDGTADAPCAAPYLI